MSTEGMSCRERIMAAIRGEDVDRLPWSPLLEGYFLGSQLDQLAAFRRIRADAMIRNVTNYVGSVPVATSLPPPGKSLPYTLSTNMVGEEAELSYVFRVEGCQVGHGLAPDLSFLVSQGCANLFGIHWPASSDTSARSPSISSSAIDIVTEPMSMPRTESGHFLSPVIKDSLRFQNPGRSDYFRKQVWCPVITAKHCISFIFSISGKTFGHGIKFQLYTQPVRDIPQVGK